jgi:ABC-type cobalamin/Fe3+-siderophores transport system ATPase subunit
MLSIKSVTVRYGNNEVLQNVSLNVNSGEVVGLIGPNGAGKSTLIRAASGVLQPASGKIFVNNCEISALPTLERARLIGVVPQARNLPSTFTVWETVLLGRTPHLNWLGQTSAKDEERARYAMQRTHISHLANRYIGSLSGGEQQRVLLARALSQGVPILLLDEPTAHLDLQYQLAFLELIRELACEDGIAILLAIHDLNLVSRFANQIALLVKGELQCTGEPEKVMTAQRLSRAFQIPLQVIRTPEYDHPLILPENQNPTSLMSPQPISLYSGVDKIL